ncbi:glycosyltransferase [Ferruginibacter paludis]|uniref:glycosyltransferase n=1 Tax=Ferruginibacter paludis TaxID=1310417 RepID=UPI0025B482BF|nr:glycosyltransferase [Ferruginibacter paludis]MDN3658249.1 glycosyltransferase [Ferruginibacter paludis]
MRRTLVRHTNMEPILLITAGVFFAGYAVLIIYYRHCWIQIPTFREASRKHVSSNNLSTKITIVIPARNEEHHIGNCLQSILNQTHSMGLVEIIVVDDHSTDRTAAIVQSFNQGNIHCIALKDHVNEKLNAYKKKAIEIAISQSRGDLIITTDADCTMEKNWLSTIAAFYENYQPAFIAAPVAIDGSSFLGIFQSLDFMTLQGITGAAVYKKIHSMCNGANLAYEKKAFYEVNGFTGIDHIASGDDMLLMHKIYTRYPDRVLFLKSPESIVTTEAMSSWKDFFNQRIRWASKADTYDDKRIISVLILVYFFNLLLLLLPITAIFSSATFEIGRVSFTIFQYWLLLLVLKTVTELFFLFPVAAFFNKKTKLWWFPAAQPFHILYTVIAGWLGKFGSYHWKDRSVK